MSKPSPGFVQDPNHPQVFRFDPQSSFMATAIMREAFRGFVGMQIFSPSGAVLDCRSAVGVDVYLGEDLVYSKVYTSVEMNDAAIERLAKTLRDGMRIELTEGALLYK